MSTSGWSSALPLLAVVALAGCGGEGEETPPPVAGGDPEIGRTVLDRYGCGSCHTIPGVRGASTVVGPPLDAWSGRGFVAGALPNTPRNLMRWIVDPQAVEPGTAMPDVGVTEEDARHMAAYLFTLR